MNHEAFSSLVHKQAKSAQDLQGAKEAMAEALRCVGSKQALHDADLASIMEALPPALFTDEDGNPRPLQLVLDFTDPAWVWDWGVRKGRPTIYVYKVGVSHTSPVEVSHIFSMDGFLMTFTAGPDALIVLRTSAWKPQSTPLAEPTP